MAVRGATYGVLCTLALFLGAGCTAPLLDGLDEPQANDLMVDLSAAGIDAEKRGRLGRFTVSVSRSDFPAAWRIARARGLPHQVATVRSGLFGDRQTDGERRRHEAAIAGFLRADPTITDARVVLGDRGAAVSVRTPAPSAVAPERLEARVRAVSGLPADAPIAVDVHPVGDPPGATLRSSVAGETDRGEAAPGAPASGAATSLWLASLAVGLMLLGCGSIWWRTRGARRTQRA